MNMSVPFQFHSPLNAGTSPRQTVELSYIAGPITAVGVIKSCSFFFLPFVKESDREGEPAVPVGLLGQGPQPGMSSVAIVPPTTGDDYDTDGSSGSDDEQRPLTQEELKNKILKGVRLIQQLFLFVQFVWFFPSGN